MTTIPMTTIPMTATPAARTGAATTLIGKPVAATATRRPAPH
jgi:hypothetical protein